MVKIENLTNEEIEAIGDAFAEYSYADGEKGLAYLYNGNVAVKEYICGYTRAMIKAGCLYSTSERHEAYIAYKYSKDSMNLSAVFELIKAFRKSLGFKGTVSLIKAMNAACKSYEETLKKSKKPYIFVSMVAVVKPYQGQGYMRKVLELAFEEGRKRNCPVFLDTDAKLKRDKYVHLGMKNVNTRKINDEVFIYDLLKE